VKEASSRFALRATQVVVSRKLLSTFQLFGEGWLQLLEKKGGSGAGVMYDIDRRGFVMTPFGKAQGRRRGPWRFCVSVIVWESLQEPALTGRGAAIVWVAPT